MVIIKNQNFNEAVEQQNESRIRLAVLANSSISTLNKVMNGEPDLQITKVGQIAEYLGFDVEISFVERQPAAIDA